VSQPDEVGVPVVWSLSVTPSVDVCETTMLGPSIGRKRSIRQERLGTCARVGGTQPKHGKCIQVHARFGRKGKKARQLGGFAWFLMHSKS
jgi:hypothetical protein